MRYYQADRTHLDLARDTPVGRAIQNPHMDARQSTTRSLSVQNKQLLAQRHVFEDEVLAEAKDIKNPADRVSK